MSKEPHLKKIARLFEENRWFFGDTDSTTEIFGAVADKLEELIEKARKEAYAAMESEAYAQLESLAHPSPTEIRREQAEEEWHEYCRKDVFGE